MSDLGITCSTPPVSIRPGRIIAEFASARDARLFAGLKREAGEQVTVTIGLHLLYAVRVAVRSL